MLARYNLMERIGISLDQGSPASSHLRSAVWTAATPWYYFQLSAARCTTISRRRGSEDPQRATRPSRSTRGRRSQAMRGPPGGRSSKKNGHHAVTPLFQWEADLLDISLDAQALEVSS